MDFKPKGLVVLKIPKRFKLFGRTIEVVFDSSPFVEFPESSANVSYRKDRISLNPNREISGNDAQLEQSFIHELVHLITCHSGSALKETDHSLMHRDEEFVDLTAQLLHQALTTMEY